MKAAATETTVAAATETTTVAAATASATSRRGGAGGQHAQRSRCQQCDHDLAQHDTIPPLITADVQRHDRAEV
jgi:hypothetical protein